MAETTVLRSKATSGYVRNSPQAGNNSQVRGTLPTVQVAMTSGGPQVQNPHVAQPAPARSTVGRQRHSQGGLPVVQVRMTASGPQVLAGSGAPDHAVKQRPQQTARRDYPVVAAPEPVVADPLSDDQLLLCRHLVHTYLTADHGADGLGIENVQLAESTLVAIDNMMLAMAAAEALAMEAQAQAAAAPQPAQPRMVIAPRTVIANQRTAQAASLRRVPRPPAPPAPPAAARPVAAPQSTPGVIIDVPADDPSTTAE